MACVSTQMCCQEAGILADGRRELLVASALQQQNGCLEVLELRQGGLHQILELLSFLQARHFGRVSAFGILQEKRL